MQDKLIRDIKGIIVRNSSNIPEGYKLFKVWAEKGQKSLMEYLEFLNCLFKEEEKAIEIEQKAPYVTDYHENGVRRFAAELVKRLIKDHETLEKEELYVKLLGQKHMAYAFYNLLDRNEIDSYDVLEHIRYKKLLYQGLVNFYSTFYGSFSDNEEAICLICKYYPKEEDDFWLQKEEVIAALFPHIKNAGTVNDLGYAYRGIERIQQYIHGLPNDLIWELLKQYNLYEILNQKRYRHQIFAIIDGSGLEETDKYTWKFFCLDSLFLLNFFNNAWIAREREADKEREVCFDWYDGQLDNKQIEVLKNPNTYWDNKNIEERLFWVGKNRIASISRQEETMIFCVRGNRDEFLFVYNDWELEDLRIKEVREKISCLISSNGSRKLKEKQMVFSLLYLDNYRGIKEQILDFDHRFTFHLDSKELKCQEKEQIPEFHFYGKAVYSLSCIVGKNGTGKTSIIDFLRNIFYKIIKVLDDFGISCEKGYIETDYFHEHKILDENVRFLVVFRIEEEDYFLTNVTNISVNGALPYQKGVCRNLDFCKIVYFSQQIRTDQIMLFESGERIEKQEGLDISRTLDGLWQCDYSEMKSFVQKKNILAVLQDQERIISKGAEPIINKELCYQFSLLKNIKTENIKSGEIKIKKFCEYLDISQEREFTIYSLKSGDILEEFSFKECKNKSKMEEFVRKYAGRQDVGIGFFSSGQYAKFVFLAKLYWFLKGYHEDIEYYKNIFDKNYFFREDALQENESALIFIDEGELYYHPEWQRRYLSTLLDMLCFCKGEARLQVVFTTNSPFVISDVLKEDVQYLSDKAEKFDDTLGQNIHKLLKENFFMDYTIGEYSRKLIETIILWIGNRDEKSEDKQRIYNYFDSTRDVYEMIRFLIQQIGEPVYRNKLEIMLEKKLMEISGED